MTETTLLQNEPTEPMQMSSEKQTRPPEIPEKFWDAETGGVRVDALLKSYSDLERKLAQGRPDPTSDEGKRELCKLLGCPDSPDGYQIDVSHGLFTPDAELNARLHAQGFSQAQVQEVYNLAAERLVPMILDMASEFQADRELERLKAEFGGDAQWAEMSRQLLNFGRKQLQPDVLRALSCSYDGVMVLHNMMKADAAGLGAGDPAAVQGGGDLQTLMRDPKYWRDRDPAFIAKVTQGFERLYRE